MGRLQREKGDCPAGEKDEKNKWLLPSVARAVPRVYLLLLITYRFHDAQLMLSPFIFIASVASITVDAQLLLQ
jgi:hypothetical protein